MKPVIDAASSRFPVRPGIRPLCCLLPLALLLAACSPPRTDDASVASDYQVVSSPVKAIVKEVLVKPGQQVEEGALLLTLNPEIDPMAHVMEVTRNVLGDPGAQKQNEGMPARRPTMEDMMAAVRADQDNVREKSNRWAESAGQVVDVLVKPDQAIVPEQPLLAISSGDFIVVARFKEDEVKQLRVGQRAQVQLMEQVIEPDRQGRRRDTDRPSEQIFSGSLKAFGDVPAEGSPEATIEAGPNVKVVARAPVQIVLDVPPAQRGLFRRGRAALVTMQKD
ncbi:biotin/lipoyl-binding protein [Herbaspirillum seropedicae]|nr:biotin/lipoyl-binding protein [Herbaspirillum seropedicae]UMU22573.1 biotin/lipoyl-binding protein [Herbaspirillum seropedicae]